MCSPSRENPKHVTQRVVQLWWVCYYWKGGSFSSSPLLRNDFAPVFNCPPSVSVWWAEERLASRSMNGVKYFFSFMYSENISLKFPPFTIYQKYTKTFLWEFWNSFSQSCFIIVAHVVQDEKGKKGHVCQDNGFRTHFGTIGRWGTYFLSAVINSHARRRESESCGEIKCSAHYSGFWFRKRGAGKSLCILFRQLEECCRENYVGGRGVHALGYQSVS